MWVGEEDDDEERVVCGEIERVVFQFLNLIFSSSIPPLERTARGQDIQDSVSFSVIGWDRLESN